MRIAIVSILLIVMIIACPLWCAAGTGRFCAAEPNPSAESIEHCCCEAASEPQDETPLDRPLELPSQCRGICGGAVVEDGQPVIDDIGLIQPLAIVEPSTIALPNSRFDRIGRPIELCGSNRGRSLRTLHASFLC